MIDLVDMLNLSLFDQSVELVAIADVVERDVHHQDHELVFRNPSEIIANELHLLASQTTVVVTSFRFSRTEPHNIVQH